VAYNLWNSQNIVKYINSSVNKAHTTEKTRRVSVNTLYFPSIETILSEIPDPSLMTSRSKVTKFP